MKFIMSLIALCAIQASYAQKIITKSFSSSQINEIRVESEYADIEIESYNGTEIVIEASVNINLNLDNDAYSFETSTSNDVFNIFSEINSDDIPRRVILTDKNGNTEILLENDASLKDIGKSKNDYKSINYGYQTDITLKIKIPENKSILVKSIYGDLIAKGKYDNVNAKITYGDIEIIQSNISETAAIDLKSTYGHVDYTVPKTSNIEFNLSTSYGEILSDLDVVSAKKDVFSSSGCSTGRGGKFTLNKGKTVAHVTATYDNIYLRGN